MKKILQWSAWYILAAIVFAALIPALPLLHMNQNSRAIAAGNNTPPTITLSVSTVQPGQVITVTGQGFTPNQSVQMYLDSLSQGRGLINCDKNGSCSGNFKVDRYNLLQGQHTIIGQQGKLIAQATLTVVPLLNLTTPNGEPKGGPASHIQLSGAGFTAHETDQVYWQSLSGGDEGAVTTDSYGNLSFSFIAPIDLVPGDYSVILARNQQNPPTISTTFTVVPPQLTITSGQYPGELTVQYTGFQGSETVSVSWNANGGQFLFSNFADYSGAGTYTLYVDGLPVAPNGSYRVTATGTASGLTAISTITISTKPNIVLSINSINPGGTLTVSGTHYHPGETVRVFIQKPSNGVVTVTVDTTGSFTASLTAPTHYKARISYYVYALSILGSDQAKAALQFQVPQLQGYSPLTYGDGANFYGSGFLANEPVTLWWNYQQQGQTLVNRAIADNSGSFQMYISVPSNPNVNPVEIATVGDTSKLKAIVPIQETAGLSLNPSYGIVGTAVQINGGGFASGETVTLSFGGISIGTVSASKSGAIYLNLAVPSTVGPGNNTIYAKGETSGVSASIVFSVNPTLTITPNSGSAGTTITVNGSYYSPSSTVNIYWFISYNETFLTSVTTTSTGTFTTTITAPSNIYRGTVYYVWGIDGPTNAIGSAAFFVP